MKVTTSWGEMIRFGSVGLANTVLTYGIYAGLVFLGVHYVIALVCDYLFAILFSLVANKWFTFRHPGPITWGLFTRMALSYGALWVLNTATLWVLVDGIKVGPYVAQAVVTVVIAAGSFLLQRFAVFRAPRDDGAPRGPK